jgi:hypothetical protein
MLRKTIAIGILALFASTMAFAQVNATVSGTVSDPTGALIPGVEVNAENLNTGITTTAVTNETGAYLFASLQPGAYRVSASLSSFRTQTFQNVQLSQSQQVRLNFTLEVAAVGTAVEVTTDVDATLAATSASIGDALPEVEVRSLPLAVRDVLGLIATTAGAVGRNFGGQDIRSLNIVRDGLIINDTRYGVGDQTNGQNATFVSPDLVEEIQIVTGNVDSASGRGSGQVALQTRSGTNAFHGALFYSNNNSALNAQGWFDNLRGAQKNYLNRTQYGGRLGGPIIRNKAFFFVLVDNQRYLGKQNFAASVFTAPARTGIFRYVAGQRNGNALSPTPSVDRNGNVLNPAGLRSFNLFSDVQDPFRTAITTDPWWRDILTKHMPEANDFTVGDGLNTAGHRWVRTLRGAGGGNSVGNNNNRDQLNLRFDYQLNSKNSLTFTTSREEDSSTRARAWPSGFDGQDSYYPNVLTAAWSSTISSTLLNEVRFGRKQTGFYRRSPFQIGCCLADSHTDRTKEAQELFDRLPKSGNYAFYPIPTVSLGTSTGSPPNSEGNIALHTFDGTRGNKNPTLMFSDNVSWTRGRHSLKMGFEAVFNWSDGWNMTAEQMPTVLLGNGGVPVRGITTARFPGLQAADITTAENILNDLSGSIGQLTQGFIQNKASQKEWDDWSTEGRRFRKFAQNDWSLFFKDSWNATSNLTLTLGARYDKYGVFYEANGLLPRVKGGEKGIFAYATNGSLTEVELVGKNSPNPSTLFYPNDWNNFAPSVGFSYNVPWLSRTTVVRGGYGVNYSGAPVILDYELAYGNSPGSVTIERPEPATYLDITTAASTRVFPVRPSVQPGIAIIPLTSRTQELHTTADNRTTPYIQSFNLSLQHEIMPRLSVEIAYSGNKGTKLYSNVDLNTEDVFSNGILEAFNTTRIGGNHPLFNQILMGLNIPGVGVVNGTTLTGSEAFRRWASTRTFLANGSVGQFAAFLNSTTAVTGAAGGLLRNGRLPENFIVASPQFGRAELWGNHNNSTYHALQIQLRKQLLQGYSGQLTYTWSKGLGDAINSTGVRNQTNVLDPRNRGLNKGRLSFDRTHGINAHGTWELPFGPGRAFLANAPSFVQRMVEGWQFSSIVSYRSGAPLSITTPIRTITNRGANTMTPNVVGELPKSLGNVRVGNGFVQYFEGITTRPASTTGVFGSDPNNLAQFVSNRDVVDGSGTVLLRNPEPGKVGTLGLRWVEGPGQLGFDLSLAKRVQIREGIGFTIRADAVNVLNTPQWGNPNVDINNVNFGQITTADGARTVTINARLDF